MLNHCQVRISIKGGDNKSGGADPRCNEDCNIKC